jgi:hypothetical protein
MPWKSDVKLFLDIEMKQILAPRERGGGRRHQRTWGMKAEAENAALGDKRDNNHLLAMMRPQ